jgi:hypothetical protein
VLIAHINQIIKWDYGAIDFKLVNEMQWTLSFLWVVFDKKKIVDFAMAKEACDVLAYIGLKFINVSLHDAEVIKYCCNQILSVVTSYIEQEKKPEQRLVFDLLIYYWYLKWASDLCDHTSIVNNIDASFSAFLAKMNAEFQQSYCDNFNKNIKRLELDIEDSRLERVIYRDRAWDILRELVLYKTGSS